MKRIFYCISLTHYLALAHLSNVLFHRLIEYVQFLHYFQLHLILQLIHFGIDTRQELTLQFHIQHVANYVRKVIHYVLIKNLHDRIPQLTILTLAEKMIIIVITCFEQDIFLSYIHTYRASRNSVNVRL